MPACYICEQCGFVIHAGFELLNPMEIIRQNGGKCPGCGKNLLFDPEKVELKLLPVPI